MSALRISPQVGTEHFKKSPSVLDIEAEVSVHLFINPPITNPLKNKITKFIYPSVWNFCAYFSPPPLLVMMMMACPRASDTHC